MDVFTWSEDRAKELGIDYDPAEFWIERTKKLREVLREKEETLASYRNLAKKLENLLEQPRHPALIPAGKLAFLEGTIVNTNDILALLGDSWFALRSVPQCKKMIERRTKYVEDDIKKLKDDEAECEKRLGLLEYFSGIGADHTGKKKKVVRFADEKGRGASLDATLAKLEEMELKGEPVDLEEEDDDDGEEEEEEEEDEPLRPLTDDEIQSRLKVAGLSNTGAKAGILSKLDTMVANTGAAPQPKYATPAQIFDQWTEEAEKKSPAPQHPPSGPAVVNDTVVVRNPTSSCIPPPPPPMRQKKVREPR